MKTSISFEAFVYLMKQSVLRPKSMALFRTTPSNLPASSKQLQLKVFIENRTWLPQFSGNCLSPHLRSREGPLTYRVTSDLFLPFDYIIQCVGTKFPTLDYASRAY